MRVASLVMEGQINSIYRSFVPMEALAQRGHVVHVEERNRMRDVRALAAYDVVWMWRFYHDEMAAAARRLHAAGVAIVWDNDDDLTAIPKDNPGYRRIGGLRGQQAWARMTAMMRLADVVTTPSEHLAQRYREGSGADVRVLENVLPTQFVRPRALPRPGVVTVGWAGALEHEGDARRLGLRSVFKRLLDDNRDIELVTIGLDLRLDHPRYRRLPMIQYAQLPGQLATFDIALAPLADIPFNRARSDIKLKEYGAIGLPWLASPVGPYRELGEAQGGRLVPDDGWYDAIVALARDADTRRRLALRARTWARGQTIASHVQEWEDVLELAAARARARSERGAPAAVGR